HHGGILGGITTGMPLIVRMAVKPTPSIGLDQDSVNLYKNENAPLAVTGRHDPCITPRAVPVMEAAVACVIYDLILQK
ncbi:MAG: chorismate synthase, partial [Clostridia bacterium]|nr:chorismate synthase [Clostridia bacterium]